MINAVFVFLSLLIYPLLCFALLVFAFAANNRHKARTFLMHVRLALGFVFIGTIQAFYIMQGKQKDSALALSVVALLLILVVADVVRMAISEEKKFIAEMRSKI